MESKIFRPGSQGSAAVLGSLESAVMNAVWEIDAPATVGEVTEHLERAGQHTHYSSAKTTLNTLTGKGYLTKRSIGKANAFAAALSREEFERRVVGGVLTGLMRNHRNPLMASLAETLAGDPASLDEFERLIAQQRAAKEAS
ncbi:MAG: BlaI/MecI/CopY family transcriptional regulator [Vulcanimicrobiaceae bacterium]